MTDITGVGDALLGDGTADWVGTPEADNGCLECTHAGNSPTSCPGGTDAPVYKLTIRDDVKGIKGGEIVFSGYVSASAGYCSDSANCKAGGSSVLTNFDLSSVTKTGYTFTNVTTGRDTSYQIITDNSGNITDTTFYKTINADTTLYMDWSENVFRAGLDSKYYATSSTSTGSSANTSAAPTPIYIKYNTGVYSDAATTTQITKLTTLPAKAGYTFQGFYSGKAGTGTKYINADGTFTSELKTAATSSGVTLTLYAHYSPIVFQASLDSKYYATSSTSTGSSANITSASPTALYIKYNTDVYSNSAATTAITELTTLPKKTGYTFQGFYSGKAGTGTQYINADGTFTPKLTTATTRSAMTLYAHYTPACIAHKVQIPNANMAFIDSNYTVYMLTDDITIYKDANCTQTMSASDFNTMNTTLTQNLASLGLRSYQIAGYYMGVTPTTSNGRVSTTMPLESDYLTPEFAVSKGLPETVYQANITANPRGFLMSPAITDGIVSTTSGRAVTGLATPSIIYTWIIRKPASTTYTTLQPIADATGYVTGTAGKHMGGWQYVTTCPDNYTLANAGTYSATCRANSFSVVYDVEDCPGITDAPTTCTVGSGCPVGTTTCAKTGYHYSQWICTSEQTGTVQNLLPGQTINTTVSGDVVTCKPDWQPNVYTVTFKANRGSGSMSDQTFTYDVAQALTQNAFTRTHYDFKGWSTSASASNATYTDKQSVSNLTATNGETVTLYAVWAPKVYQLTIDLGGATGGSITYEGTTYSYGATNATRPCTYGIAYSALPAWDGIASSADGTDQNNLTKTNMVFTGWYGLNSKGDIVCEGNTTISAKWVAPTCTADATSVSESSLVNVTNNAPVCSCTSKDGYHCLPQITGTAGQTSMIIFANATNDGFFALSGYIFPEACPVGTFSNKSSAATGCTPCPNGRTTADQGTKYNATATNACTVTCSNNANVASWETTSWTPNVASNVCTVKTCNTGHSLNDNACTANTTGRIILEDRNGIIQSGQFIADALYPDSVGVAPGSIKITYNDAIYNYNTGARITKLTTKPYIRVYTFGGFYTSPKCSGDQMIDANGNFNNAALTKYPTAGATATWYACYQGAPYTVTFDPNKPDAASSTISGSMADQTFYYDAYQDLTLNKYQLTGYTFAGWNTAADGSGTAYEDGQNVRNLTTNSSITLYAQWTLKKYTITIDKNGGSGKLTVNGTTATGVNNVVFTCSYGDTFTLPAYSNVASFTQNNMTKALNVFNGWSQTGTISCNGNKTITANWTKLSCVAGTGVASTSLSISNNVGTCSCSSTDGYYCSSQIITPSGTTTTKTVNATPAPNGHFALAGATESTACAKGSYSTKSSASSSCTACPAGYTTSGTGTNYSSSPNTVCTVACTNNANVYGWVEPTWTKNKVNNLCVIDTCQSTYVKTDDNTCSKCSCIKGTGVKMCTVTGSSDDTTQCEYSFTCNDGYGNGIGTHTSSGAVGVAANTMSCDASKQTVHLKSDYYKNETTTIEATTDADPSTLYYKFGSGVYSDSNYTTKITKLTTLPKLENTCYSFQGFYHTKNPTALMTPLIDKEGNINQGLTVHEFSTIYSDSSLYAHYIPTSMTIKYEPGDGFVAEPESGSIAPFTSRICSYTGVAAGSCPASTADDFDFYKHGYTFTGWRCTGGGDKCDGDIYAPGADLSDANDGDCGTITLTALWSPNTFTVRFMSGNTLMASQEYTYDAEQALKSVSTMEQPVDYLTGWEFVGWSLNPNTTTPSFTDGEVISNLTQFNSSVPLYGIWKRDVSFKYYNGATATTTTTSKRTQYYRNTNTGTTAVTDVNTFDLVASTTYGWEPIGWVLNNTTGTTATSNATTASVKVTPGALTFPLYYALYSRPVTLSYVANGATGGSMQPTNGTQYFNTGSTTAKALSLTLANNAFTKTGYTFKNWNINGTEYADGASVDFPNTQWTTRTNVQATAQWTANSNTKFVVNHYTKDLGKSTYTLNSTDNKTGTSDASLTLANLKKSITGFTYSEGFAGTATKGATKPTSGAVATTTILPGGTRVIDLYYNRNTYTITATAGHGVSTVSANGWTDKGTARMTKIFEYGAGINLANTISAANKTGYTGKSYGISGTGTLNDAGVFTVRAGDGTITVNATGIEAPTATITPAATDKIYNLSVTTLTGANDTEYDSAIKVYYSFGNSSSSAGTYTYGTAGTTATTSVAANAYRGTKYYKVKIYAADGTLESATTESSAASVTLNNKEITFNATSGTLSGTSPLYVSYNNASVYTGSLDTNAGTVPTATKTGYTFNGWYTAETGGSQIYNASGTLTSAAVSGYTRESKWVATDAQTLYAQWTANENTEYVVNHYTKNLGATTYTLNSTENKTGTSDSSLTLANLKKSITGFTYSEGFAGTATKGTTKPTSGAVATTTVLPDGKRVIDLYYNRVITTVTISKNSASGSLTVNGTTATGTTAVSFTCEYGATFTLPAWDGSANALALTNKVFTGWDKTDPITCGTADQTITAQWTTPTCTAGTGVNTTSLKEVTNNAPVCNRSSKCGHYCSETQTGTAGATSMTTTCTKTDAGYYAAAGATTQTKADAGYYAAAGACSQTAISQGCFGGEGSSVACPNKCPTAETGWTLTSTTGLKVVTDCTETTTPATSGSPIATICTAGTLTKKATSTTAWGTATASGLKAKSGRYVNGLTCSACAVGYYQGTNGSTATACTPADAGYYVPSAESDKQTACPAGTYQGSTGKTSCTNATAGTYTTGCKITSNSTACTGTSVCATNTYSDDKASTCTACATDKGYGNSGSTAATQAGIASCKTTCAGGEYVETAGAGCISVEDGYYGAGGTVAQNATLARTQCPESYRDGGPVSAQNQCITTCSEGTMVLGANAACSTPNNTTYGASWYTEQHDVTYGSTSKGLSLVNSCPTSNYVTPNNTTQSNHDDSTDCTITCAAGTVVATNNANCTTPSGSWYSGQHTVVAGSTSSSTQKQSCVNGYATPNTTTQSNHDDSTDCTITCAAGTIVANANETCTTPSGNWYVGSNTVQQGKTSTVNNCQVATNLFNPSNYKTFYGYISSDTIKAYDKNAFVYIDAEPNTTYIVSGMGDATTTSGRYAFDMSATPAAGNKIIGRVTAGGKGKGMLITTGANTKYLGVFVLSDTDKATTSTRVNLIKANVKNLQIFKANSGYGIIGNAATDHDASTDCKITCGPGEYIATANAACTNVGAGYYFAGGKVSQGSTNTRGQCTAPLTTIGYGYGANEADDCGRILHAGSNTIYLRSEKRSSPSLRVKVGDQIFYGALSTSLQGALKVKKDNTQYSVVNDWQ